MGQRIVYVNPRKTLGGGRVTKGGKARPKPSRKFGPVRVSHISDRDRVERTDSR